MHAMPVEYRMIMQRNKGKHLNPLLQLTHRKPEHETHEWIDEYKIDIDHGKQWTDVIVPRLQARRHTSKQEEIVPRRYEFVYYRASQLNQMKRK